MSDFDASPPCQIVIEMEFFFQFERLEACVCLSATSSWTSIWCCTIRTSCDEKDVDPPFEAKRLYEKGQKIEKRTNYQFSLETRIRRNVFFSRVKVTLFTHIWRPFQLKLLIGTIWVEKAQGHRE